MFRSNWIPLLPVFKIIKKILGKNIKYTRRISIVLKKVLTKLNFIIIMLYALKCICNVKFYNAYTVQEHILAELCVWENNVLPQVLEITPHGRGKRKTDVRFAMNISEMYRNRTDFWKSFDKIKFCRQINRILKSRGKNNDLLS